MEFTEVTISNLIAHKIGNKTRDGKLILSEREMSLNDELEKELLQYFLNPFKNNEEIFQFHHEIEISMNEIFFCVNNIFDDKGFIQNSKSIATELFNVTKHPVIKDGELFVVRLNNVLYENQYHNAIGIFKSENKDTFLSISEQAKFVQVFLSKGINKRKLDKGVIILENDYKNGYQAFVYEHGGADTEYWRNEFLKIRPAEGSYMETKSFLETCKSFIVNELARDSDISKADQILTLNKSLDFMRENEVFERQAFVENVFGKEHSSSFVQFEEEFQQHSGYQVNDGFVISKPAIKKETRLFKSVLKLDTNFHVYIHGNHNMIEKGFDAERGKSYYKLFFDEEI